MYNDSFANLPGMAQISIQETFTMISKVGGIIGKFIKYINVDLNTIYKAAEKMSRKGKEIPTMNKKNKNEDYSDETASEEDKIEEDKEEEVSDTNNSVTGSGFQHGYSKESFENIN